MAVQQVHTVSSLTQEIKKALESGFDSVQLTGEISNFKPYASGHWYFTLKDSGAQINCTMWKGVNNYVFFTPADGMRVLVQGRVSVYPPRGNYQFDVRSMKPAGQGDLQLAFEQLKQKLRDEGLFSKEHKKAVPQFPSVIGIVTSVDGAALRDMCSVAARRFPLVELVVAGARVQGAGAAESIADALRKLNNLHGIDVIIVARGGGSLEDLWAFNEEPVARAIFASRIPVVSGIGHETDTTIADFVADMRAETPTAAMVHLTPEPEEYLSSIGSFAGEAASALTRRILQNRQYVNSFLRSYGIRRPEEKLRTSAQSLDYLTARLLNTGGQVPKRFSNRVALASAGVEAHNFTKTLKKGFVLAKQSDKFVTRVSGLSDEYPVTLQFYDGEIKVSPKGTNEEET